MNKTALVTSLGSVASEIVIKSLKRIGFRVVGCDIYPKEWVVESNSVDQFYQAPYVVEEEKYINFIHEICQKESIGYLLPLIDPEVDLLSNNREWFEMKGITLCISPKKSLDIIRNKLILADFIKENVSSINFIPTKMLSDCDKHEWDYPIVCKPYNGRSSQGLKYIYNDDEWDSFYTLADKSVYIAEPYIKGPIVMVEIIRHPKSKKVVTIARREVLSTPHGCGLTVYMFEDKKLEKACVELAEKLDIIGCVNFEFIYNEEEKKYYFVECNPRFSAGCKFSCMTGYECVINHINCFSSGDIEDRHFYHNMYIARRYEEFVTKIEC